MNEAAALTPSDKRRIKNELAFRNLNVRNLKMVASQLSPSEQRNYPIAVICECSKAFCRTRLEMAINDRQRLLENPKLFIVAKDHQQPDIERIVETYPKYSVVEKFTIKTN